MAVGDALPLTSAQRRVLDALVRREGRVARREDIYRDAFGRPLPDGSRAVDVHIARIRRVLGERAIVTVGRVGYRLEVSALSRNGDGTDRLHGQHEPATFADQGAHRPHTRRRRSGPLP